MLGRRCFASSIKNLRQLNKQNMLPPECTQPSLWIDLAKSVFGVFVGAGLAFLANIRVQHIQRRRSNLAAGNLALAILSRQYGDFLIFRAGLRREISERGTFPGWLQVNPTIFKLSDSLKFDLPSLAFLSEAKQHGVLAKLLIAEQHYSDLKHIQEQCVSACIEREQSLSKAGLSDFALTDLHRAEIAVDKALQAKCSFLNQFLQQRASQDADYYQAAGKALHKMMSELFDAGTVMPFTAMGARHDIVDV
jgi:hypothetical protein